MRHATLLCSLLVLLISGVTNRALTQWSSDPTVNTPVVTAPNDQTGPQIVSDGVGGFIVVWTDIRDSSHFRDIYAQRFDSSGNALWAPDGVPVCAAFGDQVAPVVCSDDSSGAIVAWFDFRGCAIVSCGYVFAQRIRLDGTPAWTLDGVQVGTSSPKHSSPSIVRDGSGGAIICCVTGTLSPNHH